MSQQQKIFLISHKIPASIESKANEVVLDRTAVENSVVQSAMASLVKEGRQTHWVGALSTGSFTAQITESDEEDICKQLESQHMVPVFVDPEQGRLHFRCFSKGFIWPLFHYYGNSSSFSFEEWEAYRDVNDLFAKVAVEKAVASASGISSKEQINSIKIKTDINPNETLSPRTRYSRKVLGENRSYSFFSVEASETVFFVQDYHLMMTPYYLRKRLPTAKIGFFLHIPWPSSEIYRSLPVRDQVLTGLLASDIIGFQSFAYARHFMSCCTRILGLKVNDRGIQLSDGRLVRIEVMPIGIDSQYWMNLITKPETQKRIQELKSSFQGHQIIASRDRIDYIKGVPNKLKAFSAFLKRYPEMQGKVVLLQECLPNPEVLTEKHYIDLCEQIAQLVGSINGQFGTIGYTPIHYINRPVPPEESAAMLAVADAGLILPLRDGMNLTAYEFIACQDEKNSPFLLSEFAGAAQCLPGCLLANPWDEKKVTKMLKKLLEMTEDEKRTRHKHNVDYVSTHTVNYWITNFVKELCTSAPTSIVKSIEVDALDDNAVKSAYDKTSKRMMFIDYDGTLTPIVKMPHLATPSSETLNLISALASDPKNKIYVISGRDRKFLDEHLGKLPIGLSGEHGSFLRPCPESPTDTPPDWQFAFKDLDLGWKDAIFALFEDFTDRTPGSFIETKEVNVTWHYRNADPDYGDYQKNQMILALQGIAGKLPIEVINGDKCVEVRPPGINKGAIIRRIMADQEQCDFILCLGDDTTDEDMFGELTRHETEGRTIVTATVKRKPTSAKNYIESQRGVMDLLHCIVGTPDRKHQIRKNYATL